MRLGYAFFSPSFFLSLIEKKRKNFEKVFPAPATNACLGTSKEAIGVLQGFE